MARAKRIKKLKLQRGKVLMSNSQAKEAKSKKNWQRSNIDSRQR
jgi:hypothetical protein